MRQRPCIVRIAGERTPTTDPSSRPANAGNPIKCCLFISPSPLRPPKGSTGHPGERVWVLLPFRPPSSPGPHRGVEEKDNGLAALEKGGQRHGLAVLVLQGEVRRAVAHADLGAAVLAELRHGGGRKGVGEICAKMILATRHVVPINQLISCWMTQRIE